MRNEQNVWWYSLDCYDYQKELKVFWLKSSNFSFGHFGPTFVSWWIFLPRLIPRLGLYRYPNCTDIILKARFIHLRYIRAGIDFWQHWKRLALLVLGGYIWNFFIYEITGFKEIFWQFWHFNHPLAPQKFRQMGQNCPFCQIFYIFKVVGLEPKIFVLKSSYKKKNCRAHKIGQFCQKDHSSICLCSKFRDRAKIAF